MAKHNFGVQFLGKNLQNHTVLTQYGMWLLITFYMLYISAKGFASLTFN